MARITLSDGTRVESADIESATVYAQGPVKARTSTRRKGPGEDRLYVLLKNKKVLRLAGKAVRDDAEKLHAKGVPVFLTTPHKAS